MGKIVGGDKSASVHLKELVKAGVSGEDLDYCEKPYFRSAIWEATWKASSIAACEALIKDLATAGANIAHADYQGRTPLHEAAYYGHLELVKYMVEKSPQTMDAKDEFGQTPLFRAVEAGRHEVVAYLEGKGAECNLTDKDKCNPAHQAAFKGMPDMAHWLLYHGAWKNRFAIEEEGPVLAHDTKEIEQEPDSPTSSP
jgi:ankyrin repeat protein